MIVITKKTSIEELEAIADFLKYQSDKDNPIALQMWKQLANHPGIDYKIWLKCFYFDQNIVWDNPILPLLIMEGTISFFSDIYHYRNSISDESIQKSDLLKVAFEEKFPIIEAQLKKEKEEKESKEAEIIRADNINNVQIGDFVTYDGASVIHLVKIKEFRVFKYSSGEIQAMAEMVSLDECMSTSRPLKEVFKFDLKELKSKIDFEGETTTIGKIHVLRKEHYCSLSEAKAIVAILENI
jgi:hypothetical protein